MFTNFQLQYIKKILPILTLLAVVMTFLFCDSFTGVNHRDVGNADKHSHHQSITISNPEKSSVYNFIEKLLDFATFSLTTDFTLIISMQISVLLLLLASLLFILKLFDPFLRALRAGTLQPKKYNLAFI